MKLTAIHDSIAGKKKMLLRTLVRIMDKTGEWTVDYNTVTMLNL